MHIYLTFLEKFFLYTLFCSTLLIYKQLTLLNYIAAFLSFVRDSSISVPYTYTILISFRNSHRLSIFVLVT